MKNRLNYLINQARFIPLAGHLQHNAYVIVFNTYTKNRLFIILFSSGHFTLQADIICHMTLIKVFD